jgi:hypothetical protein
MEPPPRQLAREQRVPRDRVSVPRFAAIRFFTIPPFSPVWGEESDFSLKHGLDVPNPNDLDSCRLFYSSPFSCSSLTPRLMALETAKVTPTHIASHTARGMAGSKQIEACPYISGKLSLCGEAQSDELVGTISPGIRLPGSSGRNSAAGAQQAFLDCSLLSCATDVIDRHGGDEGLRARLALRVAIRPFLLCEASMRNPHPLRSNSRLESRRRITSLQSMLQYKATLRSTTRL